MKYTDIIALTGEGAAHPGGFEGTVQLLESLKLPQGAKILEVGCGTGRTACYMAKSGLSVTALDRNPRMLAKARARARVEGVQVNFVEGSLLQMPFQDGEFDYVFAESVTVFVDPLSALSEYARVLVTGGRLFDRELFATRQNRQLEDMMRELYEIHSLPTVGEWVDRMNEAKFNKPVVWAGEGSSQQLFGPHSAALLDPNQMMDLNLLVTPEVLDFFERNQTFIQEFGQELGYAVLIGTK
ncbi:class I SAM-dependent methyltransferase [Paenibacillus pinistramenti]|uniref:class I SAM-dependent methyltransferase n=1 Tax=Paenibacillus pinistramenti TaxID=1768003 RepID=UPI00139679A7|nr:class I SAM-dependent methyltransferase [Paenibacillus pinistramenti]